MRAGEHSDYDDLSICVVQPGLQARNRNGEWVDVPVVEGALVINIGDFLMRWTNDRWVSNRHRVINPPLDSEANERRLSLIYFCNCNYDAIIECLPTCHDADHPPKYTPIKTVDYITEKLTRQKHFEGIVKLTDCRLFSAFLHEAKPLKLRRAAIDNLPRFRSESGLT